MQQFWNQLTNDVCFLSLFPGNLLMLENQKTQIGKEALRYPRADGVEARQKTMCDPLIKTNANLLVAKSLTMFPFQGVW